MKVWIYFNEEYPKGYTTAHSNKEACQVAETLVKETGKPWCVVAGAKHWKTQKPAYYTVYTEE